MFKLYRLYRFAFSASVKGWSAKAQTGWWYKMVGEKKKTKDMLSLYISIYLWLCIAYGKVRVLYTVHLHSLKAQRYKVHFSRLHESFQSISPVKHGLSKTVTYCNGHMITTTPRWWNLMNLSDTVVCKKAQKCWKLSKGHVSDTQCTEPAFNSGNFLEMDWRYEQRVQKWAVGVRCERRVHAILKDHEVTFVTNYELGGGQEKKKPTCTCQYP